MRFLNAVVLATAALCATSGTYATTTAALTDVTTTTGGDVGTESVSTETGTVADAPAATETASATDGETAAETATATETASATEEGTVTETPSATETGSDVTVLETVVETVTGTDGATETVEAVTETVANCDALKKSAELSSCQFARACKRLARAGFGAEEAGDEANLGFEGNDGSVDVDGFFAQEPLAAFFGNNGYFANLGFFANDAGQNQDALLDYGDNFANSNFFANDGQLANLGFFSGNDGFLNAFLDQFANAGFFPGAETTSTEEAASTGAPEAGNILFSDQFQNFLDQYFVDASRRRDLVAIRVPKEEALRVGAALEVCKAYIECGGLDDVSKDDKAATEDPWFPQCPGVNFAWDGTCNNGKCEWKRIGDGICDPECNNQFCRNDGGDCDGNCAPGCRQIFKGDGMCDEACNNKECKFDEGDCKGQ